MMRFRATLAYDGRAYQGFQRQSVGIPTVQATLERAIRQITVSHDVTVIGAGRTDSGVHATGQVIAFDVRWDKSPDVLLRGINALLPSDIALQDLDVVTDDFHPRFSARARRYIYTIIHAKQRQPLWNGLAWQVSQSIDFDLMQTFAQAFLGRQDFGALGHAPQGDNTVREMFISEWRAQPLADQIIQYQYTVEGTAFLHHMVRRMVGLMVNVGRGWLTLDEGIAVLKSCDVSRVRIMAPPQGLVLAQVRYDDHE
jgi:tRNA pseudouridine38-40 synthase